MALVLAFCTGARGQTNPVPPDELSLLNGADLYQFHCTECHGWAPLERANPPAMEEDPYSAIDVEELVDSAERARNSSAAGDQGEWPEWAEMPDPGNKADDAQLRAEILAELTGAIDDVYGAEPVPGENDAAPPLAEPAAVNDRMPGATDLTDPDAFFYGTSDAELFTVIAGGTGLSMPGFRSELDSEEAIWDLVNFIQSLWGGALPE